MEFKTNKPGNLKIIFIVIFNLISGGLSYCQHVNTLTDSVSNFVSYSEKLSIYSYGITKFNNFKLKGQNQKEELQFGPNENFNIGLGCNYQWLGFGMAFNFGFINSKDKEIYGETNSLDIQLDIYKKNYFFTGNLQYYKGYYWKNPDDFFSEWKIEDSTITRPDINTFTFGFNAIHIFNSDNFSFKAAYQNTERQLQSAGSWLLGGKMSLYGVGADSSLIPYPVFEKYPGYAQIGGITALNLGGAIGYSYNFIFEEFFFVNGTFMLGINLQSVEIRNFNDDVLSQDAKLSSNAMIRFAIGCNKPKVFYGFNAGVDSFLVKNNISEYTYNYGKVKIYYGRRFDIGKG